MFGIAYSIKPYFAHTPKVPPATLTVIRDPDASVTLRHGDPLTLTCIIQLDPVVDSDVVVTGNLQGQAGRNSTIVLTSAGVYKIILDIHSLRATSSDTYTCSATVKPDLGVMYVQRSGLNSDSLDITVGKYLHVQRSTPQLVLCKEMHLRIKHR